MDAIATGRPFDMEFPLRGADGVFRTFLNRGLPLKDATGRVVRWFGTNTDISEREQAVERLAAQAAELARSLQALEAQTSMLKLVLESMSEGLVAATTSFCPMGSLLIRWMNVRWHGRCAASQCSRSLWFSAPEWKARYVSKPQDAP